MTSIHVLTGGPCAGKTTLITRLGELGYPVMAEAAAEVILGGVHHPSRDPVAFQREVLRRQLLREAAAPDGVVFADRAVGDHFGYLEYYRSLGISPGTGGFLPELELAWEGSRERYRAVFILEPSPEFIPSPYRRETPREARAIHQAIRQAYLARHPRVIEVSWGPLEERVKAILSTVEKRD